MNSHHARRLSPLTTQWLAALTLVPVSSTASATAASSGSASAWNLVIVLIVVAATVGSGILNFAAIRQWNRNWGLVSSLPLLGLLLWSAIILTAKAIDPSSHMLWQLEIFAWAMLNMIYMVTAMTAKRMFAKRDGQESTQP
ncbi:MAG: hypothetical protein WDZ52_03035 [Pseudohongiellaceae bacterium]